MTDQLEVFYNWRSNRINVKVATRMGFKGYRFPKYLVPLSLVGTTVGCMVLFKDHAGGNNYEGDERISGRTVIITGANTGLGKETTRNLANRGGRIIMACRDMAKCKETRQMIIDETFNQNIHCRKLDLASMKSIREFAENINKDEKRVDFLINNAGIMGAPKSLTEDGFELHLAVNYLGPFLLTHLLLDKLKESAPSRIININTAIYTQAHIHFKDLNSAKDYSHQEAYKQSKLALIMFTQLLAERLKDTKVTVNSVNPGLTKTDIGRHLNMNKSAISGNLLAPLWWMAFKTPEQGVQSILYAVLSQNPGMDTGRYYEECQESPINSLALDKPKAERLWAISEAWTKLNKL